MAEELGKRIQIRIAEKDLRELDRLTEFYGLNRSAVIRMLIRREMHIQTGTDPPPSGAGTTTPPHGDQ